jgi:hypothetical protein
VVGEVCVDFADAPAARHDGKRLRRCYTLAAILAARLFHPSLRPSALRCC